MVPDPGGGSGTAHRWRHRFLAAVQQMPARYARDVFKTGAEPETRTGHPRRDDQLGVGAVDGLPLTERSTT